LRLYLKSVKNAFTLWKFVSKGIEGTNAISFSNRSAATRRGRVCRIWGGGKTPVQIQAGGNETLANWQKWPDLKRGLANCSVSPTHPIKNSKNRRIESQQRRGAFGHKIRGAKKRTPRKAAGRIGVQEIKAV